jgi:predicted phosphoribosyltransferase
VINEVDAIYCPNIRSGLSYAVADAYEEWRDLDEEEVVQILKEFELQKGK